MLSLEKISEFKIRVILILFPRFLAGERGSLIVSPLVLGKFNFRTGLVLPLVQINKMIDFLKNGALNIAAKLMHQVQCLVNAC